MRFAGSVYDLLRQRGLRDYFSTLTAEQTRRRLVARLRFDDLFCCDDPRDLNESRIVVSASDVIEGPLFLFLEPTDLSGLSLEICVPQSIVSGGEPVARLLRSWIQNEDGTGRPFILNIVPSDDDRRMVTEEVLKHRDLNIRTIDDAVEVVRSTGLPGEAVARIREHWWQWEILLHSAVGSADGPRLAPYRQPASAVSLLTAFRDAQLKHGADILTLSAEFGRPCFDEALSLLEEARGRRDVVVAYFDQLRKTTYSNSDLAQLEFLRAVFFHYMFRAVASGNGAVDEYSSKVGDADAWALTDTQFDALVPESSRVDPVYTLNLPRRIISALADLSASDYTYVRKTHRAGIAVGMSEFLRTRQSEPLERAIEKLARDVVSRGQSPSSPDVARTIVFPILKVILTLLGLKAGQMVEQPGWGAGIGAATGELADQGKRVIDRKALQARSWLLERSLVRRVQDETK